MKNGKATVIYTPKKSSKAKKLLQIYFFSQTLKKSSWDGGTWLSKHSNYICDVVDSILEASPELEERRMEFVEKLCGLMIENTNDLTFHGPFCPEELQSKDYQIPHSVEQAALAAAVFLDLMPLAQELSEKDVKCRSTSLGNPLCMAVEKEDTETVRVFLPPGRRNAHQDYIAAIGVAVAKHNTNMLDILLERYYRMNPQVPGGKHYYCEIKTWISYERALRAASSGGHRRILQYIETKPDLHEVINACKEMLRSRQGVLSSGRIFVQNAILSGAAEGGFEDILIASLEAGGDVNHTIWPRRRYEGYRVESVMDVAAINGHEKIVKLLLDNGAIVTSAEELEHHHHLLFAILGEHLTTAQTLINHGASVNQLSQHARKPLVFIAGEAQQAEALKLLLKNGASLGENNSIGYEIYLHAVSRRYDDIVKVLLLNGVLSILGCENSGSRRFVIE